MKKLLLVDGNAILHRAFHAYPAFTDKEGKVVNAVYGFYAMLLKLFEEIHPDYLTICFDRGEPTFRMNMYAGYHANRPKMSDDLAPQVPRLHESLDKLDIPHYGVDGYEADDLLGTLSVQAKEKGLETTVVTGDRDLLQLVNGQVKVLMPITGITKSVLLGAKEVEEKYGVSPSQFVDYKALVGDQSDGYPGVAGIGPKGAANLLKEYGSLDNVYTHLADLKPEIAQKLATDAEQCALAKKLATIDLAAPVHLDVEKADMQRFPKEKFLEIFDEFGFNSLKKRLGWKEEDSVIARNEVTKQSQGDRHVPLSGTRDDEKGKKKKEKNENQLELL